MLTFRRPPRVVLRATTSFVALVVAGFISFAGAPAGADTASQLKAAEAQLTKIIADVAAATHQKDVIQAELDTLASRISDETGRLEKTQAEVVDTQHQIVDLSDSIDQRQGVLDSRAKVAYESGPASNLEFFLGATSLSDLQDRIEIVNAAAASDRSLIDGMTQTKNLMHIKEVRLYKLQKLQQQTLASLNSQQKAMDAKFAQQQSLLNRLAADQLAADGLVKRLKVQRQKEIEAELARARERQRQQGGGGGGSGGNWVPGIIKACPVRGPHAYSDSFGAPRYGGGYHPHAGNDIMSPGGTPIVAPFDGTAVTASNSLGGLAVEVFGNQGYVYNAHLSAFGKLGHVTTGTVIGYVGNTGDAAGGPTHDHFEWHPNVIPSNPWVSPYGYSVINGSAVDPYPYLNAVC